MRELRLSATANADYLACQCRYKLAYLYDLTADKDKDSTRIGGNWHRMHELCELKADTVCPDCSRREEIWPDCYICGGTGYVLSDPIDRVSRYLTDAYAVIPDSKTRDDWELERVILLYSLVGHRWQYSAEEDRWETLGSEIKFEVPVINPASGRKLPKAVFVGKIDRLVRDRNTGRIYVWERKSTSYSLTSEDYWTGLVQGDQISGYLYGGRYAQQNGMLEAYGVKPDDPPISGAWIDVWRKPEISPKKLSKADVKTLLDTRKYYEMPIREIPTGEVIVETPTMFGARLLWDIAGRPEFYFAQREVSRTDDELGQFQLRLFNLAKQIRSVEKGGWWARNLQSCMSKFLCEFLPLCRSGIEVAPDSIPAGYKKKHPKPEEIPLEETVNDTTSACPQC